MKFSISLVALFATGILASPAPKPAQKCPVSVSSLSFIRDLDLMFLQGRSRVERLRFRMPRDLHLVP